MQIIWLARKEKKNNGDQDPYFFFLMIIIYDIIYDTDPFKFLIRVFEAGLQLTRSKFSSIPPFHR